MGDTSSKKCILLRERITNAKSTVDQESTVVEKHNSSPVTFVVEKPVEGSGSHEFFYIDKVCDIKHP